jgi:hypothetical protein
MSLTATLPAAILETILTRLAALFLAGAGGDMEAARQAASHMLGAYDPQTEDEFRLAAIIVGFSFQALEALGQAAAADLPLTRILRLRSGAVSLSREAAKAERRLAQLQKARQQAIPAQQPKPAQPEPEIRDPGEIAAATKADGLTWTRAHEQGQREIRIAASLKRAEARFGPNPNAATQPAPNQRSIAPAI